jgi:hypothetical protein
LPGVKALLHASNALEEIDMNHILFCEGGFMKNWNERTNAFYKKLGYRIIKVEDGFIFYRKRKGEPHTIRNFT